MEYVLMNKTLVSILGTTPKNSKYERQNNTISKGNKENILMETENESLNTGSYSVEEYGKQHRIPA